jgi:hypothetical protein
MRKNYTILFFTILSTLISTNCGSISGASEQGDTFYELIQNKQFNEVLDLLDEMALEATSKEEWIRGLENLYSERGKIENFNKTGFNTSIENDENLVRLDYSVTYTNGVFKEQIEFIKKDHEYKIVTYKFNVK